MKILIIGGSGFIGSHLVDHLLAQGIEVRVYDRNPERFRPTPSGVDFRQGDFNDSASLAEALLGIDIVYHFLSTSVPATSNLDPVADICGNLIGTVQLLELMRSARVRRLVYLSSGGTVYGVPQTDLVSEMHLERPICSYGIVKSAIEKYILMDQRLNGLSPVILRASNPYGSRQGHDGIQGAVGTFLWRVARGEPIEVWGDGSAVRDFIQVSDLADACALVGGAKVTGIFNVGSGKGTSIQSILKLVKMVTGKDARITYKNSRGFDVPRAVLDISAISKELGWRPKIDLKSGIEKTWEWIQRQKK